jgi:hypothetical protein
MGRCGHHEVQRRRKAVIVFVCDGVELVIVTAGAAKCEPKKGLGGLFDRFKHPDVAIELIPIASQKAGGSEHIGVGRSQFVTGQHFLDHAVIGFVGIE